MDGASTVDFALTRFEAVDGARLEVEGMWSGVRGVRFVRPALVVRDRASGAERTLLADLEHKPWPANEGEPWVAAFPWPDGVPDVARTELAVAPSIVVPLARAEEAEDGTVAVAIDPVDGLRAELAAAAERARRLEDRSPTCAAGARTPRRCGASATRRAPTAATACAAPTGPPRSCAPSAARCATSATPRWRGSRSWRSSATRCARSSASATPARRGPRAGASRRWRSATPRAVRASGSPRPRAPSATPPAPRSRRPPSAPPRASASARRSGSRS